MSYQHRLIIGLPILLSKLEYKIKTNYVINFHKEKAYRR